MSSLYSIKLSTTLSITFSSSFFFIAIIFYILSFTKY